ncbi:hypothetical protein [Cypionkella sp.]|jgi:hypothetical protein|uniref:hypothetical protein n=1 Tax=Cypionkella sp. TaxID=2811411 RepID=UPI00271DC60E|nr:hypothetical protein [Cypionkella sp.]MDO8985376.1 hypothetical protein [Cypionkella sp.]MDP2051284.1 hypothetical protein [Cypionkella sp.]
MQVLSKHILAILGFILTASVAQAEMTGGQVKLSQSGFTDDFSVAKTNISGSVELAFGPQFGMQMDLGVNMLNFADETATNFVTHGTYKLGDSTALGAFYGMDAVNGGRTDVYGVEAAQNFGTGGVQGYLGRAEDGDGSGTVLGVSGGMVMGNGVGIGGSLDHGSFDGASLTRYGLRGSFGLGDSSKMFAELGALNTDTGSETYAKIGATYNFGTNSGLMFGDRSLFNLLPGL